MTGRAGRAARRRASGDDGLVIVLIALSLIAIMAIVAIVIDLGLARSSRRQDQSVADLAALSAGFFLSGRGTSTSTSNPFEACKAAVESAKTNEPDFTPATSAAVACSGFPTTSAACTAASPPMSVTATLTGGDFTLTVKYPVTAAELTDPRFAAPGANDGTDACQRMRVTFQQTNPTSFARVIGVNSVNTSGSAVVRGSSSVTGQGVAALLLLERVGCPGLQVSGQGAVIVKSPTSTNPGVIAADSAGQAPPCDSNNTTNANQYTIFGTPLPQSAGGGPSIVAENASGGTPGIIGIYALALSPAGKGGYVFPGGLSVQPVASSVLSRQAVDDKYNRSSIQQLTNLHSLAYGRSDAASPPDASWSVISGGECNGNVSAANLAATKVFVNCSTYSPDTNLFPNATDFVVHGNINIGNNKVLALPVVQRFFVRGCAVGGCNGSNTFAIQNAGELIVNTGETALASPDPFANGVKCSARLGPGQGGSTTNWTELTTFSGSFSSTGKARLCQTFVYMGTNTPSYSRQSATSSGGPENYPAIANCSATLPCPKNGVEPNGFIAFSGGNPESDWSAPNQLSTQPTATDFATYPFEDLALWNETSSNQVVLKGKAGNLTQGVFFLPNALAMFQGQGAQPITLNAQFLIRSLNMSGQGNISLAPSPNDSILTPVPGNYGLIR